MLWNLLFDPKFAAIFERNWVPEPAPQRDYRAASASITADANSWGRRRRNAHLNVPAEFDLKRRRSPAIDLSPGPGEIITLANLARKLLAPSVNLSGDNIHAPRDFANRRAGRKGRRDNRPLLIHAPTPAPFRPRQHLARQFACRKLGKSPRERGIISRDETAIEAREKAVKVATPEMPKRKCGRPKNGVVVEKERRAVAKRPTR